MKKTHNRRHTLTGGSYFYELAEFMVLMNICLKNVQQRDTFSQLQNDYVQNIFDNVMQFKGFV